MSAWASELLWSHGATSELVLAGLRGVVPPTWWAVPSLICCAVTLLVMGVFNSAAASRATLRASCTSNHGASPRSIAPKIQWQPSGSKLPIPAPQRHQFPPPHTRAWRKFPATAMVATPSTARSATCFPPPQQHLPPSNTRQAHSPEPPYHAAFRIVSQYEARRTRDAFGVLNPLNAAGVSQQALPQVPSHSTHNQYLRSSFVRSSFVLRSFFIRSSPTPCSNFSRSEEPRLNSSHIQKSRMPSSA